MDQDQPTASVAEPSSQPATKAGDDFDAVLDQFERETASASPAQAPQPAALRSSESIPPTSTDLEWAKVWAEKGPGGYEDVRQLYDKLSTALEHINARELLKRNMDDFNAIVQRGKEMVLTFQTLRRTMLSVGCSRKAC